MGNRMRPSKARAFWKFWGLMGSKLYVTFCISSEHKHQKSRSTIPLCCIVYLESSSCKARASSAMKLLVLPHEKKIVEKYNGQKRKHEKAAQPDFAVWTGKAAVLQHVLMLVRNQSHTVWLAHVCSSVHKCQCAQNSAGWRCAFCVSRIACFSKCKIWTMKKSSSATQQHSSKLVSVRGFGSFVSR